MTNHRIELAKRTKQPKAEPTLQAIRTSAGSLLQLAAPEDGKPPKLTINAYTGDAIEQWWSDTPLVIDLASIKFKGGMRPLLFSHDPCEVVGHVIDWSTDGKGIVANAVLSGGNERTVEIATGLRNGLPWQASIGGTPGDMELIKAGESVTVNGRQFTGPIRVARNVVLDELSIVALGADDNTSTKMAAQKHGRTNGDNPMTFEQWLLRAGLDKAKLTDKQLAALRANFDTAIKAGALSASNDGQDPESDPETPASQPGAEPINTDAEVKAHRMKIAEERSRIAAIDKAAAAHPEIAAKAIAEGWAPDRVTAEVELAELRASRSAPAIVTRDKGSISDQAATIEARLLMSKGTSADTLSKTLKFSDKVVDAASREGPATLGEVVGLVCAAGGVYAKPGRVTNDTIRAAFKASQRLEAGGASTISLPGILGNVANKAMLEIYRLTNTVIPKISAIDNTPDFKQYSRYRLASTGSFQKVGPDGELKQAQMGEDTYNNKVDTWGSVITLTRQMFFNDDLGAFLDLPIALANDAMNAMESEGFRILLGNSGSFFSAGNGNYISGADTVLGPDSLSAAKAAMRKAADAGNKSAFIEPWALLVPPDLEHKAQAIVAATSTTIVVAGTSGTKSVDANANVHAGSLPGGVFVSAYLNGVGGLTNASATAWYLLANPALRRSPLSLGLLNGQATPTLEQGEPDFDTLGIAWRCFHDFGIALREKRAAVMSKGAV